jgi:AraC family transcriptional regulator
MARAYVDPPQTDGFTTTPTDDLLVCVTLRGTYKVECQRPKGWSWAIYRPGAVGLTAPGTASSLRWKSALSGPLHSLHIHLGRDNLEQIAAAMSINDVAGRLPDVLLADDEFALACSREIWRSLRERGSALHAETIAQAMGSHLMVRGERLRARSMPRPAATGALSRGSVKRVREYMLEHLAETVSLDDLALVANVSKFHLPRSSCRHLRAAVLYEGSGAPDRVIAWVPSIARLVLHRDMARPRLGATSRAGSTIM